MADTPITRLITVQGPAQMLNCLALLIAEREARPEQDYQDYLILHRMWAHPPYDQRIFQATLNVASVWNWKGILDLRSMEGDAQLFPLVEERTALIHERTGLKAADEIFLARNYQISNQLLMLAYPEARKICYGDGFGQYDEAIGPEYLPFDEGRFLIPYQAPTDPFTLHGARMRLIDSIPYTVVGSNALREAIHAVIASRTVVRDYLLSLRTLAGIPKALVLTGNLTEAREFQSVEDEVQHYLSAILTMTTPEQLIILKPHPRQYLGQAEMVTDYLMSNDLRKCLIFGADTDLSCLPIEIFAGHLDSLTVINASGSVSGLYLQILYRSAVKHVPLDLSESRTISHYAKELFLSLEEIGERVDEWDGCSLLT